MKTKISIPDPLFKAAEQLAQQLGMSRSELYTTAIAAYYVEQRRQEHITEQLNQIYTMEDSSLDEIVQQLQDSSLPQEDRR